MKKLNTLLLIDDSAIITKQYETLLSKYFGTIIESHNEESALAIYLHYKPDAIIIGCDKYCGYYMSYLKKRIKKESSGVILIINTPQVNSLMKQFDYNFMYCLMDKSHKLNLHKCLPLVVKDIELAKH